MADLRAITQDPNYINANPATKRAIFDKYAPQDPNYAKASPATQQAIRQKFGIEPAKAPATPAAPVAPPETFGEQVLGGAASTADLAISSIPAIAGTIAYPIRRAAGLVTGETAEDVTKAIEAVKAPYQSPVGDYLGVSGKPSYQGNMLRQALGFVAENMDKGADYIANTPAAKAVGLTKPDVQNMMEIAAAVVPVKIPGKKTAGKVTKTAINKMADIIDPKTAFYRELAGGSAVEILNAARAPEAQIVKGAPVTFAQATAGLNKPKIAAVGEQAVKLQPEEALRIQDVQEAARVGELRKIENTPQVRKQAEAARERRSGPLYEAAETAGDVVDVSPTLDYIDGLTRTNPGNPQLLAELRRVRRGLVKRGLDAEGNPVELPRTDAKEIASTLDGIKTALAKEDNKFIKGELTNIKDDLIAAIPSMKEAQTAFRKGSKPINQMDIGKYLREKLESPLPEGTPRAGVFAKAVQEAPRTIKNALDNAPRYEKLTDVLSPPQQARVDAVLMDLSRDARVKEMAKMARDAAPELAKPMGEARIPGLLNRVATLTNAVLQRMEGKVNEKIAMEIALEFLDARKAADALEVAMKRSGKRMQPAKPKLKTSVAKRIAKRAPVIGAATNQDNWFLEDSNRKRYSYGNRNAMTR